MSAATASAASFPEPLLRLFGAEAINGLMAAPGFPAAIEAAADNAVRPYDGSWIRNRLLNDRGRLLAVLLFWTCISPRAAERA